MDVSPTMIPRMSNRGSQWPTGQTSREWEDRVFELTDEIAEREDIPHEVAYRYALQRLANVIGGTQCSSQ